MEEFLQVGVISSTHGIAGEVKVFPTTDDVKRFKKLKEVILDTGKERMTLHICQVKFFKQMVILKFKEFQNINEVERFRGKSLYVTRENAVKLQKDDRYTRGFHRGRGTWYTDRCASDRSKRCLCGRTGRCTAVITSGYQRLYP